MSKKPIDLPHPSELGLMYGDMPHFPGKNMFGPEMQKLKGVLKENASDAFGPQKDEVAMDNIIKGLMEAFK
jgi:hypothetical protein